MTRKDFLQTIGGIAAASAVMSTGTVACGTSKSKLPRGVSFYSYQATFFTGQINLEGMIAEAASMGAYEIEMLPDENIPTFPEIPDEFVRQWHGWMDKYHTVPNAYCQHQDIFGPERLLWDIEQARRLGFQFIRLMRSVPTDMVEKCLPAAEKAKVALVWEIHGPLPLDGPMVEDWVKTMEKAQSRYLGINPDFSLWEKKPAPVKRAIEIRNGLLNEKIADYIDRAYAEHVPEETAWAEAVKMGAGDFESEYLKAWYQQPYIDRWPGYQDPKKLLPLKPWVRRFHAKFYEMTDDFRETCIPYEEIIPFLVQNGFEGALVSECERTRNIMDAFPVDEIAQARRHQVMLKQLLGA